MTPDPLAAAPLDRWLLDPALTHLNHGSFGACPRVVLDRQAALRAELERQPVDFFLRRLPALLDHARGRLADFIDAPAETLAFVRNVSAALNAVLRSLRFEPGDEILVTDHGYGAATLTAQWVAKRWGARVVTAALPFPAIDPDRAVEAITAAVTRAPGWRWSTTSPARPGWCCPSNASSRRSTPEASTRSSTGARAGHGRRLAATDRRGLLHRQPAQVGLGA